MFYEFIIAPFVTMTGAWHVRTWYCFGYARTPCMTEHVI
jgi:hypothetical protein